MIDKTYLPFTAEELKPHFVADIDGQIAYYQKSADRYHRFMEEHQETAGIPLTEAKTPRQIEKDERFWTITAIKSVFDHHSRFKILTQLLVKTFGPNPPIPGLISWEECLDGELRLYFEACLPSPQSYVNWLRSNLHRRQMIPYVLDAAARDNARTLEGATHVDAMFLNVSNGFAWLIEAKVLSDVSYQTSFDNFRNQISRNIDVMLDDTALIGSFLEKRDPQKSIFSLLTPLCFKEYPSSRLYGWIMQDYKNDPYALERDLPHRKQTNWDVLQQRIGWVTFEDFQEVHPGA
ncbi:hypothetical protein [Desulfofustis glycolicus]|uniref:Uncharacterized protein n=1 Tax=Desulfofustis glycolicus DSM 9705 TaxID=1121409 RepID=A0A1M5VFB0_9BACT|nr:hypothetical protein [Desulfofustis glycolicus]SHH73593.1 hypothetical protein SAMN02745124_01633 [Desulfofustis glycolicus DSM 9705]